MKQSSGFTLIELLLVLAIIGVISSIAIPTLIGQRSRSRDRSSVSNVVAVLGELVETWDRTGEGGAPAAGRLAAMVDLLNDANMRGDVNPWDSTRPAYRATMIVWALPLVRGESGFGVDDIGGPTEMTGGVTTGLIQAATGATNFTKTVALD